MAEIRKNQQLQMRFKSSKAFQELEKEVDKIETQKIEEIKAMNGE